MRRITGQPRHGTTILSWVVGACLAAVALAVLAPGVAFAHANIDRAEPAPDSTLATSPRAVRIWFTEPVAANASGIEVLDTTGRRVDANDSRVDLSTPSLVMVTLPALPDGTYTVAWRNTSAVDGHPLRGTYAFAFGVGSGTSASSAAASTSGVSPLDPYVRWAVLGGLLTALGVEVFGLLVLAPALATREARGVALEVDWRIVLGALAVFAIGSLAHLALQVVSEGAALTAVLGTRWGEMWLLRMALVAVALPLRLRGRMAPRMRVAANALLAVAASTFAFASHAAATRGLEVTAVGNDVVHTLASGVWVGGLIAMLTVVRAAHALPETRRRAVLAAITTRFSPLALIVTGALLITGLYASWLQVAAWAAFDTAYGWAVIAKGVAYVALIVVAAVNLLWVTRRLASSTRAAGALAVTVGVEVALVLAALLTAGFLTSLEPARAAFGAGGQQGTATSWSVHVSVSVSPGSIGTNRIEVRVDDRGRPPPEGTSSVTLAVQYVGADLGANEVPLKRDASGVYVAERVVLSIQGPWQYTVGVSGSGSFDTEASVRLPVAAAGVVGVPLPEQVTALLAAGWEVVLLALLVLGVAEMYWKGTRTARFANWGGATLMVVGIMMVYGIGHFHDGSAAPTAGGRPNPIVSNDASIALGRELYQQRCVACHGLTGMGDGSAAAALNPPPARLPLHVPLHSDGDIFAFIEGGFPGSAMPAFRGTLSEEQMWHLVNYLRTLKDPPTAAPAK